jgi:hypothetical protein
MHSLFILFRQSRQACVSKTDGFRGVIVDTVKKKAPQVRGFDDAGQALR